MEFAAVKIRDSEENRLVGMVTFCANAESSADFPQVTSFSGWRFAEQDCGFEFMASKDSAFGEPATKGTNLVK